MRLPMMTRKLTRSYSGGGYSGSSDSGDEAVVAAEAGGGGGSSVMPPPARSSASSSSSAAAAAIIRAGQQRRQRRRRNHRSGKKHGGESSGGEPVSLLFIFLVLGLIFCMLDSLYIWKYITAQHDAVAAGVIQEGGVRGGATNNNKVPADAVFDSKSRPVQTIPSDWPSSETGKEPIIRLLKEATGDTGTAEIDPEIIERLPSAQQVADLYGTSPVVLGLETCERFQNSGFLDPAEHFVSTAGTFNTGTNLMAELLIANCHMPARMKKYGPNSRGVRWQVLWGKHTPVHNETFRLHHRTYTDSNLTAEAMFPAVTVRDPFKWMQSMCRHSYGADWPHDDAHCPNLVPNEIDKALLAAKSKKQIGESMNVTVKYAEFDQHHDSLAGFWNDWYNDYVTAQFPRLIVRFEDVVFHPKQVTKTVCECAGGEMNMHRPFKYIVDSAKKGAAHGKTKTSYVDALVKYGTEAGRYRGFEPADLEYARQHLDPNLMRLFGYHYPPPQSVLVADNATNNSNV